MSSSKKQTANTSRPIDEFKYRLLVISADEQEKFINRLIKFSDSAFPDNKVTQAGINSFLVALNDELVTNEKQVSIKNEISDYFKIMAKAYGFDVIVPLYSLGKGKHVKTEQKTKSNFIFDCQVISAPENYETMLWNKTRITMDFPDVSISNSRALTVVRGNSRYRNNNSNSSFYNNRYDEDDYWGDEYYGHGYTTQEPIEKRDYYVIGYGSLVNERSRRRTIPNIKEESFVKVKGYSRLFNVGVGQGTVLNVMKNENGWLNAVLVKIPYTEVAALRRREIQYDEVVVPKEYISFPYGGHKIELEHDPIIYVSKSNIKSDPKFDYVQACIYGTSRVSNRFAEEFIGSTFLHDGTRLRKYLMNLYGQKVIDRFKTVDSNY